MIVLITIGIVWIIGLVCSTIADRRQQRETDEHNAKYNLETQRMMHN